MSDLSPIQCVEDEFGKHIGPLAKSAFKRAVMAAYHADQLTAFEACLILYWEGLQHS